MNATSNDVYVCVLPSTVGQSAFFIMGWDFFLYPPHINGYLWIPLDKWSMNFTFLTDFEK